jgi:putative membrane protein
MADDGPPPTTVHDSARVRDHLANERTFLAWTRTGIAMMGFGFLVAKLRFELAPRAPGSPIGRATLGVLFAVAGIITIALATWHYFAIRAMIDAGTFRPFSYRIIVFSAILIAIGITIIINLVGIISLPW